MHPLAAADDGVADQPQVALLVYVVDDLMLLWYATCMLLLLLFFLLLLGFVRFYYLNTDTDWAALLV